MNSPESILASVFGHDAFRPGQRDIIGHLMDGDHVLAVMPTGAGKSLCYQVPALLFDRPTIVVSPLVALMDNQVAGLRANGAPVSVIHSGQSREQNVVEWRAVASGVTKLLYLSPERLMTGRMLSAMRALDPAMFVVDEAHCVSKWGPAFRPEYADLSRLNGLFPKAKIAAFTATADAGTRRDIAQQLFNSDGHIIVHGFDRPNLSLNVLTLDNRPKQLLSLMKNSEGQSGIVYCLSRKNTEKFAEILKAAGYNAMCYHAGMSPEARYENLERFMAEDAVIMVATIAFGMGIDKSDIRFVYHMNLPSSLEAYYQEIGRAGRDGAAAQTALIYGLDDIRMRRQFIADDGAGNDHKMREHKRLDALLGYCEAAGCRRQVLMAYFGEQSAPCGNCDTCLNPPDLIDATSQAQAVFAAIAATGERFGTTHVIAMVRGDDTDRIAQFGHDKLPAFGGGANMGKPYLQSLLRQIIAAGYITVDMERYGAMSLTDKARDILNGGATFHCKDPTPKKTKQAVRAQRVAQADLSDVDQNLLSALKAVRMSQAREIGKPAFVVFSDATLISMAKRRPKSRAQMLEVSGVGETKFARYGEVFLAAIKSS